MLGPQSSLPRSRIGATAMQQQLHALGDHGGAHGGAHGSGDALSALGASDPAKLFSGAHALPATKLAAAARLVAPSFPASLVDSRECVRAARLRAHSLRERASLA
jgi:hypothetical protein